VILGVDASRAVGDRTGVGRNVIYLLRGWAGQDFPFERIRVFTPGPLDDVPDHPRIDVEVLARRGGGLLWQATSLRRAAADVDVLLGHYSLPPGWSGRGVVYNLGILGGRHRLHGLRTRARARHFRESARRAEVVIANSESTKADLVRFYELDPDKVEVVWPGAAPEFRPARPGDEETIGDAVEQALGVRDARYLLFVGKLSARRNVPALIDAFAVVRESRPDLRLLIVGPNTAGVEIRDVGGAVRHVEFLDHDLLAPLYRGARAFVLPTEQEGFSHTIPEAMASGCPVVTAEHAALGDAGLRASVVVVPEPTPTLLAHAIGQVLDDDELRDRLIRAGLETGKTLTWDETARRTMAILARVATRA
jgi:glycosyltransferase involved in cell wall biosynthesis